MQKLFIATVFAAGLTLGGLNAEAQHNYVKDHPVAHSVKRPPAPSKSHVWVGSEFSYNGGKYAEVPGHWEVPPHGHRAWVAGHWAKESRGSYWVPGHWA